MKFNIKNFLRTFFALCLVTLVLLVITNVILYWILDGKVFAGPVEACGYVVMGACIERVNHHLTKVWPDFTE